MPEKEKKILNYEDLAKADGAGYFSAWSDKYYNAAGVEIVGPGILWNDGYKFQGKEITITEADRLAFFTYYNGRPATSIQEAIEFWDDFEPGVWS